MHSTTASLHIHTHIHLYCQTEVEKKMENEEERNVKIWLKLQNKKQYSFCDVAKEKHCARKPKQITTHEKPKQKNTKL